MYKRCTTEESAQRQREFALCLLELMQLKPYQQITIGDICAQMGLSRKSFYRYFSSREECLMMAVDLAIAGFALEHASDRYDLDSLEVFFRYWQGQKKLLGAVIQNRMADVLIFRGMVYLSREYSSYEHEHLMFLLCGVIGVLLDWHKDGYRKTPAELAASLEQLLRAPSL